MKVEKLKPKRIDNMKKTFVITVLFVLFGAGLQVGRGQTFTAAYSDTDGLNQIGSQNLLTFYWNFDPAGSSTWTWAVFGFQGTWYYCNYEGNVWGELATETDDGSTIAFSTAQFGGIAPNAITTDNSMNTLVFTNSASTVIIDLNLDSNSNLSLNAVTAGASRNSVTKLAVSKIDGSQTTSTIVQNPMVMTSALLAGGDLRLACGGMAGTNYVLERAFSLTSPDWTAQATNAADANGVVIFTNTPVADSLNFWRVRSQP